MIDISLIKSHISVESDRPISLEHEVDLRNIAFFLENVPIFWCRLVDSRHKAERELINKVGLALLVVLKESSESLTIDYVLKQKS